MEVQSGKGFSPASGTFSIQELNMGWTASIQKVTEDKAREVDKLAFMSSSAKFVKPFEGGYKTFVGSAEWKTDGRLGGKAEGNLIEGQYAISKGNEFSFKSGHGEVDLNAPYSFNTIKEDFFTGNIIGGKVGITGLENSISTNSIYNTELQVTQKFLDGSLDYGIEDYTFKDDAELTIHKYELALKKIDIPDFIPFIGEYDIEIRGEFGIGTFGYKLRAGRETGLYVGGGKVGGGIFAKFTKPGEE
ncbi:WXG100 family type VII secretion target [Bacillus sp. CGMCC 1.60114]|uniref:WXG100 family type VII secretion target n=1 Tax=unclassified Bacillus (in: firmicutes) TaxID=185979 RepID=UPI00363539B2